MNNAVHYEDALMVKAAWYYYFENMTQQAIADRLSISRMRVIKLLDAARQSGVIQFRLRSDSVGMMQQSRELMQKYHLNDVFIIPEAEQEGQLNESIARAGAMYVADRLSESACINVGYGDTLSRTLNHLATMVQNPVTCISLTGGVSYYLPNGRSNIFNARLYLMPAPLLASSHEMAAAMRAEASVSEIIRMAALSSFTLVGIGAMHETATIVRSGIITQNELFRLKMSGAVGDVLCHFVDENGELIPSDIEDRLISTPLEKLRAMDNVVGLAAGAQKVEAIRAVLRGGYLDVLITDNYEKGYRASRSGVAISATNAFGGKGMIVKVYDGKGYAEYSTNEITAENLPEIEREIEQQLMNPANFIPEGTEEEVGRAKRS
mgnify:CR=1 FL=1